MQKRITKRMRLVQKKRKKNILLSLAALGLLIIAYAGLGWGLVHQRVAIVAIAIEGHKTVNAEQMQATVMRGLAVTRGLLLYGGTIFTYDRDAIKESLLYEYPRLETVEIKASELEKLNITVTEREPVAQWCEEENCYLLDKEGFIFEKIDIPDEGLVIYSGNLSGDVLRQNLLHREFVKTHEFIKNLKLEGGVDAHAVKLLDGEAEIVSNEHPLLKVKLDDHLERTISYVQVTLDSQEYKDFIQAEEAEQRYVDLRFGNRVYYK